MLRVASLPWEGFADVPALPPISRQFGIGQSPSVSVGRRARTRICPATSATASTAVTLGTPGRDRPDSCRMSRCLRFRTGVLLHVVGWDRPQVSAWKFHAIAWTSECAVGRLPWVGATDADLALQYLADVGFTPIGLHWWRWDGTPPEETSDEPYGPGRRRHAVRDSNPLPAHQRWGRQQEIGPRERLRRV
jgi:hypothetical protein